MSGLGFQSLVGMNNRADWVYFLASADPTRTHLYRVSLGTMRTVLPERLTSDDGVHGLVLSRGSEWCVQSAALMNGNVTWTVRNLGDKQPSFDLKLTRETPPWTPKLELDVVGDRESLLDPDGMGDGDGAVQLDDR